MTGSHYISRFYTVAVLKDRNGRFKAFRERDDNFSDDELLYVFRYIEQ